MTEQQLREIETWICEPGDTLSRTTAQQLIDEVRRLRAAEDRLGAMRTCDACGVLHDRAGGEWCACQRRRAADEIDRLRAASLAVLDAERQPRVGNYDPLAAALDGLQAALVEGPP